MRELVAEGIIARLADFGLDAGQIGQMQIDARELLPGEILGDRRRHEFLVLGDVVQDALASLRRAAR